MASRLENIKNLFGNLKTRSIIIITAGLVGLVIIVGIIGVIRNKSVEANANAQISTVRTIQSVPGLQPVTAQYADVQQQLNTENYQQAVKSKTSTIPTLIGVDDKSMAGGTTSAGDGANGSNTAGGANANANGQAGANGANSANGAGANGAAGAAGSGANANLTPAEKQMQAQLAALQKQLADANNPAYQQQLQQSQQAMQTQAQQLIASWSKSGSGAPQVYVASSVNVTKTPQEAAQEQAAAAAANPSSPVVKAGDIVFAVLTTGVNSDEPSPVMATIMSGPLKGAKLVGSIQPAVTLPGTNGPTKVVLNFNLLNIPSSPSSVAINAVAIDPDTARTALASDVDHHYLSRYGSVFAAAFLQGYGQAVQQSGTQVMVGPLGNTNISTGSLSGVEEVTAGLGQVGQQWGSQLNQALSRQNTVIVNAGISIGILFMQDVTLNNTGIPTPLNQQPAANTGDSASAPAATSSTPTQTMVTSNNTTTSTPQGFQPTPPAAPGSGYQTTNSSTTPNNNVQTRQIAPGVFQQYGPIYPIYTQNQ